MFEKFTGDAREIVIAAQREAVERHAPEITPIHVLQALLRRPDSEAGRLLTRLGVPVAEVAAEAERVRRRGGISEADATALGEFGIDVDRIVERLEQVHGPDPFTSAQAVRVKRRHVPFADESKKTLEICLKEVIKLGGRELGSQHILLALAVLRGPAADVLARFDVDAPRLRQALSA
ncbi:ATPase [Amycolatopsis sp. K13G38]|uniref:ATPase n=1 Tax=Amycolatopsis acididurans TaxID=2724524 RepID=A0ABX1J9P9_9PSEU|nr:Clp protease N-terminal domain-containing protein [Amycolatopsis acididurans]NKQ55060.1 ATPase [Amycolatopsis acididurans]